MSIAGMIVSGIGVLAALIWVMLPLFRRQKTVPTEALLIQKQREHLLVFYEQVLRTIHDLDEDYHTGKLNQDMYDEAREQWMQRGTQILQALDEMPQIEMSASADRSADSLDDEIESQIAQYLSQKAGSHS